MPAESGRPVTPEEIVSLILEELRSEAAPGYYSDVVRSVYQVYLRRDEFERLKEVLPFTREEARRALDEELAKLNQPRYAWLPEPLRKRQKKCTALGPWVIDFHENTEEDAEDDPLIIHSAFALPQGADDRAGPMTERIVRRSAGGQTSTSTRPQATTETAGAKGPGYAVIEYEDKLGAHSYEMVKNRIKVGRGGEHVWVDLKLEAPRDVSREHLEIRREPSTGEFFLKNLSKLGTTVNGRAVPACAADGDLEAPLPEKARIGLAGVVFLQFKAAKS